MEALKGRNKGGTLGENSVWCRREARDGPLKRTGASRSTNVAVNINAIDTDGQIFALFYIA